LVQRPKISEGDLVILKKHCRPMNNGSQIRPALVNSQDTQGDTIHNNYQLINIKIHSFYSKVRGSM